MMRRRNICLALLGLLMKPHAATAAVLGEVFPGSENRDGMDVSKGSDLVSGIFRNHDRSLRGLADDTVGLILHETMSYDISGTVFSLEQNTGPGESETIHLAHVLPFQEAGTTVTCNLNCGTTNPNTVFGYKLGSKPTSTADSSGATIGSCAFAEVVSITFSSSDEPLFLFAYNPTTGISNGKFTCTGGLTPEPTRAPTPAPTPSPTPAPTNAPTSMPTASPSAGPTAIPSASPSAGPTASPTGAPTSLLVDDMINYSMPSPMFSLDAAVDVNDNENIYVANVIPPPEEDSSVRCILDCADQDSDNSLAIKYGSVPLNANDGDVFTSVSCGGSVTGRMPAGTSLFVRVGDATLGLTNATITCTLVAETKAETSAPTAAPTASDDDKGLFKNLKERIRDFWGNGA